MNFGCVVVKYYLNYKGAKGILISHNFMAMLYAIIPFFGKMFLLINKIVLSIKLFFF